MLTDAWLGKTLTENKQALIAHLCNGRCSSFDDYRFVTGQLRMIAMLEEQANNEIQKRRQRDAEDMEVERGQD